MLLLYHSHKHISYPIRTIARSAILILYCPRSKFLLNSESIKYSCASSINL
ncbi:hypothetical protein HCR08_06225 [Wolbachia pipientis]|uniref:hypothetical protein n=2 Tax=Wolbachia TaxID=953 RepID=UPI0015F8CA95|nr:hypothetical protein [Wolbachia pipientis]MBA8755552.1 hypothetical protein [Wolbachia pipientis]